MEKNEAIIKSLSESIGEYPPIFKPDYSPYRNCYAHALNALFEDREYSVYSPGAITAIANGSEIETDIGYYFRDDLFIKLIKRDCSFLSIIANPCDFSTPIEENMTKMVATYSKEDNDFHFLRLNRDNIWSHKPGFGHLQRLVSSRIIDYKGESKIEVFGKPYKVIEIMKLQKMKKNH